MIGLSEAFADKTPKENLGDLHSYLQSLFQPNGFLQKEMGLEHRPEQEMMAKSVADAWITDSPILFEAGTGVGKSMAYLIPGIIHSIKEERPCIVSTHTIALQEQIEQRELPFCRQIFAKNPELKACKDFKQAILLGKGNYLCGTRLTQAIETKTELFPSEEQNELERIADWYQTTNSGLKHDLNPPPIESVWEWVNADGSSCNKRNCTAESCYYRKALAKLREANVIIVNHSLFFSLLGAGVFPRGDVPGILFPEDFTVIDEAHTIPGIATDYFGAKMSNIGLQRQLSRLYSSKHKKRRGLLVKYGNPYLITQVRELEHLADSFFKKIKDEFLLKSSLFRLQEEGWIEHKLDEPLKSLITGLSNCENRLDEGAGRDEIAGAKKTLESYRECLRDSITLSDDESVYWLEKKGAKGQLISLNSAPLDVAPQLRERLFNRNTGILLTSATLAEGSNMDSFKRKIGAESEIAKVVNSPFDYDLQMRIYIAEDAPLPGKETDLSYLHKWLPLVVKRTEGGVLVLFTSYRELYEAERVLRPIFAKLKRPLYCQGIDGSRSQLLHMMKDKGNAVLFGTDSFWTGVDVPGKALSHVVMVRLPFDNPSHPIAQARAEHCLSCGGVPFHEITLPDAIIKFRQGWGRLIRRQTDSGTLTLFDSRILKKSYGTLFLNQLPHSKWKRLNGNNWETDFHPLNEDS